jgi:hypothetical protein
MDKRKKLISLASGVAGLVLVASVIVLAQVTPGASSSKPMPTVTVTVTADALADQKPKTEGDPSRPDISASEFDTPPEIYTGADEPALPADSFDLVSDPDYPAAKNKLELKFFKVAQDSCEALRKTGAKLSFSDYTYALIALDSKGNYTGNRFDAQGFFIESFFGMDTYPPAVCEPSVTNEHFDHASESLAYNFLVETTDEVGYVWHAHHGSSDLSNDQFVVRDGKIVSVLSDGYFGSYDIRYGLNKLEKKSALKQY